MNYKRSIGFGAIIYILFLIVFLLQGVLPLLPNDPLSLQGFIFLWVVTVPIVLLAAKWLFKTMPPSFKKGLVAGVIAIGVAVVLERVFIGFTFVVGKPVDQFNALYSDWKWYVTALEVVFLSAYAGFEYDRTYTAVE